MRLGSHQLGPDNEGQFRAHQSDSWGGPLPHPDVLGAPGPALGQIPDRVDSRVSRLEGVVHLLPLVVGPLGLYERQ